MSRTEQRWEPQTIKAGSYNLTIHPGTMRPGLATGRTGSRRLNGLVTLIAVEAHPAPGAMAGRFEMQLESAALKDALAAALRPVKTTE